jgi:low affinity Fe/Cu permease
MFCGAMELAKDQLPLADTSARVTGVFPDIVWTSGKGLPELAHPKRGRAHARGVVLGIKNTDPNPSSVDAKAFAFKSHRKEWPMASENRTTTEVGIFSQWASYFARHLGSARAFGWAIGVVLLWGLAGPLFRFSDTWQLVINTGTTIITFLMVFLIQNTQNRDSAAIQLKLNEIIRSTQGAHNAMLGLENLNTDDLDRLRALYQELADKARCDETGGSSDIGTPDVKGNESRDL